MRAFLFYVLAFFSVDSNAQERVHRIIPGKSLGPVVIGSSSVDLSKLDFAVDTSIRGLDDRIAYMKNDELMARLVGDRVVQIWAKPPVFSGLRFRGKPLPAVLTIDSFKKFFRGCQEIQGSGGILVYCEKDGLELSFPGADSPVGISVISPEEAKRTQGQK